MSQPKVWFTGNAFWDELGDYLLTSDIKSVIIASYTLYTGIKNFPHKFVPKTLNPTQKVCQALNVKIPKHGILINELPDVNELRAIKEKWPKLKIKIGDKTHAKYVIINKKIAYIGSANMTQSTWNDVMIETTNKPVINRLLKNFMEHYSRAQSLRMSP